VLILPLSKNLDFSAASGRRSLPSFDEKGTLEQMETGPKISLQCFLILYFLLFIELLEALKHCSVVYCTHVHD
jgi:hypothetical protein